MASGRAVWPACGGWSTAATSTTGACSRRARTRSWTALPRCAGSRRTAATRRAWPSTSSAPRAPAASSSPAGCTGAPSRAAPEPRRTRRCARRSTGWLRQTRTAAAVPRLALAWSTPSPPTSAPTGCRVASAWPRGTPSPSAARSRTCACWIRWTCCRSASAATREGVPRQRAPKRSGTTPWTAAHAARPRWWWTTTATRSACGAARTGAPSASRAAPATAGLWTRCRCTRVRSARCAVALPWTARPALRSTRRPAHAGKQGLCRGS
mmetsp:Transcript_31192/g.101592  ORF Transcript_31192/g.101592 Transcript_31192/m.101592 type:complete len:267 (-) Transcript_31192:67-867(-)